MSNPILVESYKQLIPQKGVWYKYQGDIFISVMRQSKPYIRRKYVNSYGKRDKVLSDWHSEWQYDIIELLYGLPEKNI